MTIDEAVKDLLQSDELKRASKEVAYIRTRLSRYYKGELKTGALIELLQEFGYTIEVKKPRILKYKTNA